MKSPDGEVHVEFLLGLLHVVIAAPEEESEEGVVLSDIPHVGGVGDPGLDVGQGAGHLLLGLTEHLPGVPLQLLRAHNIDRVRDNEHCGWLNKSGVEAFHNNLVRIKKSLLTCK